MVTNQLLDILLSDDADETIETTKEIIKEVKPKIYALLNEALDILNDAANCSKYHEIVAKAKRNAFLAYLKEGFTEDQAMMLVVNEFQNLNKSMQNYNKKS